LRFRFSDSFAIDTGEEPWRSKGLRIAIFSDPGGGKSYTAAVLVEQWLDQGGTVVIFQPRAEWHTLKERYPVQVVGGPRNQDVPLVASAPRLYAQAVVEHGVSMAIYTSDIKDEEELVKFVRTFIDELLTLQEIHHRPILLVLEEAHEYCPRTPSGHLAPPWVYNRMIKILKDCYQQGRKLNVCPVVMSQRPQEVNYTIRQLCNLTWFGSFSQQDATYLDREVFAPYRKRGVDVKADNLVGIPTGEWMVIIGRQIHRVTVTEKRKTPHGADTPDLKYSAPVTGNVRKAVSELGAKLKEALEKQRAEKSELEKARRKIRELESQVEELRDQAKLRINLREIFQQSAGGGISEAELKQLSDQYEQRIRHLESENTSLKTEISSLSQKLERYGALETLIRDIVTPMIPPLDERKIEAIVDRKLKAPPARRRRTRAPAQETSIPWINVWLPKVGTAEQKILRFMAAKYPLKMTKSQIAIGVGLTAKGGYFTGALNNLVKWKLIVKDGDNYRLAEGPP